MKKFTFILAPLMAISFLTNCGSKTDPTPPTPTRWYEFSDWWNYCSNGNPINEASAEDIGKEVNLTVNNQIHKIRLIDINHDVLSDDTTKKAHCTFEFANLLSDKNGYSLATFWKSRSNVYEHPIADYKASDLKAAVDGDSFVSLSWYTKGASEKSTEYTTSALDMLPSELTAHLKKITKGIRIFLNENGESFSNYDTKLFILTHDEIDANNIAEGHEGTTYQFYKNNNSDGARIKHQVKWHEDAASNKTYITDKFATSDENFAGYNGSENDSGGLYWLSSPINNLYFDEAWRADTKGGIEGQGYSVYKFAFAIAPAFCI